MSGKQIAPPTMIPNRVRGEMPHIYD